MKTVILALLLISVTGCPKVERSAGQAMDNANKAFKHGDKKIWMDPAEEEETYDENEL